MMAKTVVKFADLLDCKLVQQADRCFGNLKYYGVQLGLDEETGDYKLPGYYQVGCTPMHVDSYAVHTHTHPRTRCPGTTRWAAASE